ncbi:SDR family NAD(P)-dependent oxidoreductase [Roseobacter sp. YSTF-M11]|uniref:SDR family NAD(P)-dependent oxidoreductase n=1 Tax=Roseobacter insulae TaxID=2859783 RepID=A0A9X1FRB5_9RHOB|nr:SDR family NAD(P)-dependent oxidoreductase [Roseobacter insulae]MBW4706344.1 SDR family NAD(P)-dependent oxidoreductase [Roseobacter insulae]
MTSQAALIVGAGSGLSAALARALSKRGYKVVLAARNPDKLEQLVEETGALAVACDASDAKSVEALFEKIDQLDETLAVVVYNPSARAQGEFHTLDPDLVKNAIMVTAYGAFLVAQEAVKRMLITGTGMLLFTGASAGVKGFPRSAPFAMGKFALRGLCQSLARELHPKNIHIAHVVIDGGIDGTPQKGRFNEVDGEDNLLDPQQIAETYMHLMDQHRSTWSWEIELRPWVEKF